MQSDFFKKYKKFVLGVLLFVIFAFLAWVVWFELSHSREETFVFRNTRTVATAQITAGLPVHLITLVDANEVKNGKHFVKIPKNATNITIKKITPAEIRALKQNKQKITAEQKLSLVDLIKNISKNNFSRKFFGELSTTFFLADGEQAVENLISAIVPDTQLVDVSSVADTSSNNQPPASEEANLAPEEREVINPVPEATSDQTSQGDQTDSQVTQEPSVAPEVPSVSTPEAQNQVVEPPTDETQKTPDASVEPPASQNQQPCQGSETDNCIAVSYTAPAPVITQQNTDTGKLVTVSAEDEVAPLTDVLAFTTIPKIYKVGQENRIKIKWKNNGNQDVTFTAKDTDEDGYLDYVEWTVPHLSEQTFEIIFISKAFQLDSDKNVLADIFSQVQTQDGTYASVLQNNYVRVTFYQLLDNAKDITVYAKPTNLNASASIEVYPVYTDSEGNQTEGSLLATVFDGANPDFSNIDHDGKYRILLQNLPTPTDVFDLKIVRNSIDIDYIVDPFTCQSNGSGNWNSAATWTNCNSTTPQTTDTVEIMNGHTVTLDVSPTVAGITINSGGILDASASNFNITNSGAWSNLGTFTAQAGTVTLTGTLSLTNGITSFYNLTINGSGKTVTLGGALVVSNILTVTAGTLAQGANNITTPNFTMTGGLLTRTSGTFNSGIVTTAANGSYILFDKNGSTPATFSGNVTATYSAILLKTAVFNGTTNQFTQTGDNTSWGSGGTTFGPSSTTTFTNTGTGTFYIANGATDLFNGDIKFENTSTGKIYITGSTNVSTLADGKTISIGPQGFATGRLYLNYFTQTGTQAQTLTFTGSSLVSFTTGTTFNGNITVTAPSIILSTATFNGATNQFTQTADNTSFGSGGTTFGSNSTTTFTNTGTGTFYITNGAADTFNGNIKFENTSTGKIYTSGSTTSTGVSTLADGKIMSIGPQGFANGELYFRNFTQTGSTSQSIALTGAAKLYFNTVSTFNGSITASAPSIYLNGATFNGTTSITKTGTTNDQSSGGNTFNGTTTINNSTSTTNGAAGQMVLGYTNADTFNGDLTVISNGAGGNYTTIAYNGNNAFNGNVTFTLNSSNAISVGRAGGGTATLANLKTFSIGGDATTGTITLNNFTQSDTNTAQTVNTTKYLVLTNCSFSGSVNFTLGRLTMTNSVMNGAAIITTTPSYASLSGSTFNGLTLIAESIGVGTCIFNGTTNITKTGVANEDWPGGNTFNGTTTITNATTTANGAAGQLRMAITNGDTFNGDVTFVGSGASNNVFAAAKVGTNVFAGNVTVSGSALGGFTFGASGGIMQFTKTSGIQTLDTGGITVPKLTHSGAGTLQLTGNNLTTNSVLTNSAGTLDLNGKSLIATSATFSNNNGTISLNGNETITGLTMDTTHGTFLYYGTSGPYTIKNYTYNNLTINGSGATFGLPATTTVNGSLIIIAGTLDSTASNYNLNVAGNWSNSGTFTARAGTVLFNGTNQKIFGNTTFNNFTKDVSTTAADTIMFQSGQTQAVASGGVLTLKGAVGKILTLRACDSNGNEVDINGTRWGLNVNALATQTVDYVNVKHSDASSGSLILQTNSIDSGDNPNWQFNILPSISGSVSLYDAGTSSTTDVTLIGATTKNVACSATVYDTNGYADLIGVTAVLYRSGVGADATDDNSNHYTLTSQCIASEGSGNTQVYTCTFPVQYYADATDSGAYSAQNWLCQITPSDHVGAGTGSASSPGIEMDSLKYIDVSSLSYGSFTPGQSTSGDHTATVTNKGNISTGFKVSAASATLNCATLGNIPIGNQQYSLSSFTYGSGTALTQSAVDPGASIDKPTQSTPLPTQDSYWQMQVPYGTKGVCSGSTNFIVN